MNENNNISFSRKSIRKILTSDWISRKERNWKLIPYADFEKFTHVDDYDSDDEETTNSVFLSEYVGHKKSNKKYTADIKILFEEFKLLDVILTKFKGKIALCGGSLVRLLMGKLKSDGYGSSNIDVDLFFYNTNQQEATQILEDCMIMMANKQCDSFEEVQFTVEHREHVVNFITISKKKIITYQFVLRIYPTLSSIIGGFDLGPSMLAYGSCDGIKDNMIYATELGAWSIVNKIIIVDTTRRST